MNFKISKPYSVFLLIFFFLLFSQYSSGKEIKILTNHIGYEKSGTKHAVILGNKNDTVSTFKIINYKTKEKIFEGVAKKAGHVYDWKEWFFWTLDFDEVQEEGTYYIQSLVNKKWIHSFPFQISEDILEKNTISDIICYFKSQRCTGLLNKADKNIPFKYDSTKTIDAQGGWQDATGDYGIHLTHLSFSTYFNPQQVQFTAWSLFKSYELLKKRNNSYFKQYLRRILDEAMYGADFLVRMKNPEGSFYRSIAAPGPGKKPEDRYITTSMKDFSLTTINNLDKTFVNANETIAHKHHYEAGFRAGAGIAIAALAAASTYNNCGDFSNQDYLTTAEDAFAFLKENNIYLTNDGKENIIDDYCALTASMELYRATNKKEYKNYADRRVLSLINRLTEKKNYGYYWRADNGDRPFFHAADAGFPIVSLLFYYEIADDEMKNKVLEAVKKSLEFELTITEDVINPFGYSRQYVQNIEGEQWISFFFPHYTETAPWWQGENARLASMATVASLAAKHFTNDKKFYKKLTTFAADQLNWILGLNPYDNCMLDGSGRNNPWYMFFGSYEYSNVPGGICNGITAGLKDKNDIDFNIPYSETGKDNDWRWSEQWLPHSSWFLFAVSARK